jgi:hypothetical protein
MEHYRRCEADDDHWTVSAHLDVSSNPIATLHHKVEADDDRETIMDLDDQQHQTLRRNTTPNQRDTHMSSAPHTPFLKPPPPTSIYRMSANIRGRDVRGEEERAFIGGRW